MAKVKEDRSRVTLEIDGKQAVNQLGKLEMEAKQLAIDLKAAKKGTQEYVDTNKKLKETEAQIKNMRQQIGLTGMTMTQLSRYQRELRKEIQNTTTQGTDRYRELNHELQKVNTLLNKQRKELNGTAGFFGDIKKELKSFAVLAAGALGVNEIFSGMQNLIRSSADLSDSYANVQKTTELTKLEMEDLMALFKGFNTRTPRSELLALAEEAGKMGIRGVKNIASYVEQTNELTTALGDLGDDAGLRVAKMADRFDVSMRQIGSGINAVADNTKASAPFITEFLSRLSGAANEVGISAGDILGYGAAIDEMGLNVEMSSTALNGFIIDFTKNTEKFGKVAGFAEGELSKLVGEQGTNAGFLAFLERLRAANPEAADFLRALEEIGINGDRGSQVFLALSQNVEQLRSRQALANAEIEKGTSLTEEYNKKNQNFAGNLEKVNQWLIQTFVNSKVSDALNKFVGKWAEWIKIPISQKMEEERMKLNNLHAQILTTNTGSEERIRLINELKTLAPDVLGNLDAETISNQELGEAVRKANEQLVNRIIIQAKQEEIEKNIQNQAEKKMDVLEQENKLRDLQTKLAAKYGITIEEANSPMEQFEKTLAKVNELEKNQFGARGRLFNQTTEFSVQLKQYSDKVSILNGMESFGNQLLEEKNQLIERLGVNLEAINPDNTPTPTPGGNGGGGGTGGGGTPAPDPEVEKFAKGLDHTFKGLRDRVLQNQKLTIEDTQWMYDQLGEMDKEFGTTMKAQLDQRIQNQRDALQTERDIADAKQMIAAGLSTSLGAAIDFIGNKSGELTSFQKILTLAQIAIDSAAALGKIVPLAAEASEGTGPAAPFVFAGYVATMAGTVLTAIDKAKNALSGANVPEYNDSAGDQPTRSPRAKKEVKKSFYYGGDTGSLGIGLGDQYGDFAGFVHKNEYVIPSMTVSDPYVANLLPAIEQIRQDNIRGFSSKAGGMMDTAKMEALLMEIAKGVRAFPTKIKGEWVITDLEEAQEERDYLSSRYRAN